MKHVCQPVDIRAVKLYNVKKEGGVRQFGAKYITGGNPVW